VPAAVKSVLVVDDDEDLREILSDLFVTTAGSGVVTARSLAEVQRHAARALACDVALLDVNLGEGEPTGVEVCGWLRAHGFSGEVIFLTGHANSDPRVIEASRTAHAKLLSKPISVDALIAIAKGEP
jgi:DNA-binding response OmpR family regulator